MNNLSFYIEKCSFSLRFMQFSYLNWYCGGYLLFCCQCHGTPRFNHNIRNTL